METSDRNRVVVADDVVTKVHGGPDGATRATRAAAAQDQAGAFGLPVPEVVAVDGPRLATAEVAAATDGVDLLGTAPATVLAAIGAFARSLHNLPPPMDWPLPSTSPAAFVHGDLCPVNLLFDADGHLVAVVDWEDSHMGDPLVDLAWAEWLVRTWHPGAVDALVDLYAAYDAPVPAAERRQAAMAACLERHAARATDHEEQAAWDHRRAALAELDLRL